MRISDWSSDVCSSDLGDGFGSRMLAGVGVIFYVLLALRRKLRDAAGFDEGGPDLATLLDLVAVGTVADLVPLDADNRALVSAGLRRLLAGQCRAGLPPSPVRPTHRPPPLHHRATVLTGEDGL